MKYTFSSSELKHFLRIAIPMMVSTGTDAIMMFVDRLFLSHYAVGYGEAYINAALIGALTSFAIISFFVVIAGYSNVLVAQYYGAKQEQTCPRVISQVMFFSLAVYPIILLISALIPSIFAFFSHSEIQTRLESSYTQILLWGSIFSMLRSGVGGFFIGIHKTRVIMLANTIGMLVNIPLNYLLIFGVFGPPLGIIGAALATIISSAISFVILLGSYYGKAMHKQFCTRRKLRFDWLLQKKLLFFGFPAGVETVCSILVFDFFIAVMNSYGEIVGSAVTIAINWDSMFFIPMMGIGFATSAIVGQHMGAGDVINAKRSAWLAFYICFAYSLVIAAGMLGFTAFLVEMFLGKMQHADAVRPLAKTMVRLASVYLIFDALNISMANALRGAGDTRAVMLLFLGIDIVFGIVVYALVLSQRISAMAAWFIFIGFAISLGLSMLLRFLQGRWQSIQVV